MLNEALSLVNAPLISVAICADPDINVLEVVPPSNNVNRVDIEELGAVNEPEISEAICADPDNITGGTNASEPEGP